MSDCRVVQENIWYYYYYYCYCRLVTRLFFLVLLLNKQWSPPLRLQVLHCSTYRIMCDVPSIAVFCGESIEYFPGTASKCFLKLLVTIPVAPIITGIIVHCKLHIHCIPIPKLLYFNLLLLLLLLLLSLLRWCVTAPWTAINHGAWAWYQQ